MNKIYGYCRVALKSQNLERQHRNILDLHPNAIIIDEIYTGNTINRPEFNKLLDSVQIGDTIVFDSVSIMSRNSKEGCSLYAKLFSMGVELIFIKQPYINTKVYKNTLKEKAKEFDDEKNPVLRAIRQFVWDTSLNQVKIAFDMAELEAKDISQYTKEGIEIARLNGKQIGQKPGKKLKIKKSIAAKKDILKFSRDFEGTLKDVDVIRLTGLARNTYYKYKKELTEELKNK